MPIDFAKRVAQQKLPSGISQELYSCMQFISTHINEPISATDVVVFSGKSRAYLFKKFQRELGMSIGAYITYCRIREAKSLLRYTDKSLGEISCYLCFSSQSHFQNVFKKQCGITPTEYRKNRSFWFDFDLIAVLCFIFARNMKWIKRNCMSLIAVDFGNNHS